MPLGISTLFNNLNKYQQVRKTKSAFSRIGRKLETLINKAGPERVVGYGLGSIPAFVMPNNPLALAGGPLVGHTLGKPALEGLMGFMKYHAANVFDPKAFARADLEHRVRNAWIDLKYKGLGGGRLSNYMKEKMRYWFPRFTKEYKDYKRQKLFDLYRHHNALDKTITGTIQNINPQSLYHAGIGTALNSVLAR